MNNDDCEPDAYDYLERAINAVAAKDTIKYAEKALELSPDMLDAEYLILSTQEKSNEDLQSALEMLLLKGERQLEARGISRNTNAGEYYCILETRPYMRIYYAYLEVLAVQEKLREAIETCEDILYLNKADNLGVRYYLMALYATVEDEIQAESLYKRKRADGAGILMTLPLIALYYKRENKKKLKKYIKISCEENAEFEMGLQIIMQQGELFQKISNAPDYFPGTREEVVVAYCSYPFLYKVIPDFIPWLFEHLPKKKPTAHAKPQAGKTGRTGETGTTGKMGKSGKMRKRGRG